MAETFFAVDPDDCLDIPVLDGWGLGWGDEDERLPPVVFNWRDSHCGLRRTPNPRPKPPPRPRLPKRVVGVNWNSWKKRWMAVIVRRGVRTHLGAFKTREEAIRVRKAAERSLNRS